MRNAIETITTTITSNSDWLPNSGVVVVALVEVDVHGAPEAVYTKLVLASATAAPTGLDQSPATP